MGNTNILDDINQRTDIPVSTDAGLVTHPSSINPFGAALVESPAAPHAIYTAGKQALKVMHESLSAIAAADRALRQAPPPGVKVTLETRAGQAAPIFPMPPDKIDEFNQAMAHNFSRAGASYEKAEQTISAGIEALDKSIDTALMDKDRNTAGTAQAAGEIRSIIRAAKPEERSHQVEQLIKDGEHSAVAAILGAPPLASGLTRAQMTTLRTMAAARFAAVPFQQREAAGKLLEHLKSAAVHYSQTWQKYVPAPTAKASQAATASLDRMRETARARS